MSGPEDDVDALAVIELRFRQAIMGTEILGFRTRGCDGSVSGFRGFASGEICSFEDEVDLGILRGISFKTSFLSSTAALNSEHLLS